MAAATPQPPLRLASAHQRAAVCPRRRTARAALLLAAAVLLCPGRPERLSGLGLLAAAQMPAGAPGLGCTVITDVSNPWQPQTVLSASHPTATPARAVSGELNAAASLVDATASLLMRRLACANPCRKIS